MNALLLAQVDIPIDATATTIDVGPLSDAMSQGHWSVAAGLAITILVAIGKRIGIMDRVPKTWVPWLAVALGLLTGVGAQLAMGRPWVSALIEGFIAGASASGFWELGVKHVAKKKDPAAPVA